METTNCSSTLEELSFVLTHDLGAFEGFNFRDQEAIDRELSAQEVIDWDHDDNGEAEFWPSHDHPGVALIFAGQSAVSCSELLALDQLLDELGDDSEIQFLRIHHALERYGIPIQELTCAHVEDSFAQFFVGSNFIDLRQEAAYELFETFYPEEYRVWERSLCDGLIFDIDRFLDSPSWSVDEVQLGDSKALIVEPQ